MAKLPSSVEGSAEGKKNLQAAKINLILKYPFLGYLVMGCRYHFSEDIDTAGASVFNGNKIFINEEFFNNKLTSSSQRTFVILHEILHIFFEHQDRRKKNNYNADLYNIAADYFINYYLDQLGNELLEVPEQALLDKKRFLNDQGKIMSSDEIYHKLLEENNNSVKEALENETGGTVREIWVDGNGNGQAPLDEIPDEEIPQDVKNENKQALNSALSQASQEKKMGSEIGGLIQELGELLDTKIPWNELLADFIETENNRQDFTYSRWNHRSGKIIFPSTYGESLKVFIGIDSSGSMIGDDLNRCVSEIQGIMDNFEDFLIEFWTCDTEPFKITHFSSDEGHTKDDLMNVQIQGGGGTEISGLIEAANESENDHNVCVILSDFMIPEEPFQEQLDKSQIPVFSLISPDGVEENDLNLEGTEVAKMD